jgi:hypothetical protein
MVSLLKAHYQGSLQTALATVYPSHKFLPWRFVVAPKNFWNDVRHQRQYMDWLREQLALSGLEDWYNVAQPQVKAVDGSLARFLLPNVPFVSVSVHEVNEVFIVFVSRVVHDSRLLPEQPSSGSRCYLP